MAERVTQAGRELVDDNNYSLLRVTQFGREVVWVTAQPYHFVSVGFS